MLENRPRFQDLLKEIELQKQITDVTTVEKFTVGVAVSLLTFGLLAPGGEDLLDTSKRSVVAMSDNWLKKVATSDEVSEKGLLFLAKCLKKEHQITVEKAILWSDLEKKEKTKTINTQIKIQKKLAEITDFNNRQKNLSQEGGQLLLAKAKNAGFNWRVARQSLKKIIVIKLKLAKEDFKDI